MDLELIHGKRAILKALRMMVLRASASVLLMVPDVYSASSSVVV
jgi:hypothetical protein